MTSKTSTLLILSVIASLIIFPTISNAQVPQTISHQGYLTDTDSNPVDGSVSLTFSIYNVETSGTALWSETQTITVNQGVYNVVLGGGTIPHPINFAFDEQYWLGVEVEKDGEMTPRQILTAVPYALSSNNIANNIVTTQKIVNRSVTNLKLADNSVTDSKISGLISAPKIQQGHGSGLDADTVDGQHASDIISSGGGVPSGFSILGLTIIPPSGYTYSGDKIDVTPVWITRADMPTARKYLGVKAVNSKIYAIGGNTGGNSSANEEYDPATNTWTTKTSMPTARYYIGVAAVNGKIYAIGGYGGGNILSSNEEYDPATNTWTTKASMPTARYYIGVAAVNGKIYAIGGYGGGNLLSTNEEYDPATNTWTTKTSMLIARHGHGIAAVNGKIYAIGGWDGGNTLSSNEEYDPATNTWTTKASMPTARQGYDIAAVNGKIYAIGGYSDSGNILSSNEEYDPATNTWTTKTSMLTARTGHGVEAVNGKIYAIGGSSGNNYLPTNESIDRKAYYIHIKN